MFYRLLFAALFRRMDPERAHRLGFGAIRAAAAVPGGARVLQSALRPADPALRVRALGLTFPGPFGLAAGFDKNAVGIDGLAALGFAFVEIGTVTARPQPGNPAPRMFRLPRDRALVNRMGFNNDGAAAVARRLAARRDRLAGRRSAAPAVILGVNIGKTKAVPEAEAVADYIASAKLLAPYADYLVVNVSSPNTPGLRDLQAVAVLRPLLTAVREAAEAAAGRHVPLLVKIAPDLADEDVDAVADLAVEIGLDGIVATNTTIGRLGLTTPADEVAALGAGGLSGPVLRERSLEVLRRLRKRVSEDMTIIGVGGVTTPEDAAERLAAGATLLQGFTGFIYEGPFWAARIHRGLRRRMVQSGLRKESNR
ncbi:MAG TPA: quinone-dependent dihydroorotate dehydrogenase [Actinocrinis sp.]|jgi:dihydroorotate dehydrogenase|uniref:quinone-dependent dihydroorotate dehydrogenase n=1 Tax=Actinocrinis sp. TaxID=1920516 RepID=UPI002DDD253A|nr:quinone-dependent dihydroorotate dehydrogenase [Actinocrinis sp.]HEV3169005.1 quinone-dependent dihydroorotate dehydrogenase [Actinocrinis sp.]